MHVVEPSLYSFHNAQKMKSRVCYKEHASYMLLYFQSLRSLMNVVEPAVREIMRSTHASNKPASLHFVVVDGALCRLQQMGARVILDPMASIQDVLDAAVQGFNWADLDAALKRAFPGGKGRYTLFCLSVSCVEGS
jgi:hypothetical protein